MISIVRGSILRFLQFKVTTKNFQFLLILASPLVKSSGDTSPYYHKDFCQCMLGRKNLA